MGYGLGYVYSSMVRQVGRRTELTESQVSHVRLRRVGRAFGSTVALRGVSAEFDAGRAHLILGANGSGKTTLLRIISTMLRPSFGQVSYGGVHQDEVRATMGWVSHEALVYPDLSGEENLLLAASLYGLAPAESLASVVDRFHLGPYLLRPVRTMSRGQRQRVALARAFLHGPSLVLLDEPTTGLDSDGLVVLLDAVRAEVDAGHVVLVVTHDPQQFAGVEHQAWTLVRGRWAG